MQHRHHITNRLTALASLVAVAGLALTGCGDDGDSAIDDCVLTVEMSDFTYGDLPGEVPVGTRIQVTNSSDDELHEFVTYRLATSDGPPAVDGGPPHFVRGMFAEITVTA